MGIIEDVVGTIVLQIFRPCLPKILTFSANGNKNLVLFLHKIRLKSLQIKAFGFNQQALIIVKHCFFKILQIYIFAVEFLYSSST